QRQMAGTAQGDHAWNQACRRAPRRCHHGRNRSVERDPDRGAGVRDGGEPDQSAQCERPRGFRRGFCSLAGLEAIGRLQLLGVSLALSGALFIILRPGASALSDGASLWGDLLVVGAMMGWSGYTLLQSRAAPNLPFLG